MVYCNSMLLQYQYACITLLYYLLEVATSYNNNIMINSSRVYRYTVYSVLSRYIHIAIHVCVHVYSRLACNRYRYLVPPGKMKKQKNNKNKYIIVYYRNLLLLGTTFSIEQQHYLTVLFTMHNTGNETVERPGGLHLDNYFSEKIFFHKFYKLIQ